MREVVSKAKAARAAALQLANVPTELKNIALKQAASAILENSELVLSANSKDVALAKRLQSKGRLSKSLVQRLKLDEQKLRNIAVMVESVAKLEDPVGKTLYAMELDENLELYKVSCPIGVIGAIFESRPDVLPQISSLSLKSGNAVILKGERRPSILMKLCSTLCEKQRKTLEFQRAGFSSSRLGRKFENCSGWRST